MSGFALRLLLPLVLQILWVTPSLAADTASAPVAPTPSTAASPSKERSRLEELFIWKASEELKLAPRDEAKFTEIIHSLNTSRRAAGEEMDAAVEALEKAKSKSEIEKALSRHRAALKQVQAVQMAELDRLKPLLGSEKLAKYLVVKNTLLEKLKALIAAPAK